MYYALVTTRDNIPWAISTSPFLSIPSHSHEIQAENLNEILPRKQEKEQKEQKPEPYRQTVRAKFSTRTARYLLTI